MKRFKIRNNLMTVTFMMVLLVYLLMELGYFDVHYGAENDGPLQVADSPSDRTDRRVPSARNPAKAARWEETKDGREKPEFLSNYKNPCWRDETTLEIFCLPYFYLLGFGKSGTTSIFQATCTHPGVVAPPTKEFKFWREGKLATLNTSVTEYARLFHPATSSIKNRTLRHGIREEFHYQITGEGTPSYIWDGHFLAKGLSKISKKFKFIISMRDPTDRLFSHYHHDSLLSSTSPFSPKDFHDKVTKEINHLKACFKKATLMQCITGTSAIEFPVGVRRSIYAFYIKSWLDAFPREQFLFLRAEDFYLAPLTIMDEIYTFLDLSSPSAYTVRQIQDSLAYFHTWARSVQKAQYRNELWPVTRNLLDDFYAPFNHMLRDLLKHDKYIFPKYTT